MIKLTKKHKLLLNILGLIAIIFGIMTIKSGSFALFGGEAGKKFAGNYVPFVLWFNFIAGFFYIITGICIVFKKNWSWRLSAILTVSNIVVFVILGIYIFTGAEYENKTVVAMSIRTVFWLSIYLVLSRKKSYKDTR